jgi:epoxyqueuosine reductase
MNVTMEGPVEQAPDRHALAASIKDHARRLGFELVGIAPAEPSKYQDYLRRWLDEGQAGEMSYLQRRVDERVDPARYVTSARSVICVAMNHYVPLKPVDPTEACHHGRIARYALGSDYHDLIKTRLHALADQVRAIVPDAVTRACVDTAPVMEKEHAARSGVGWFGKNSCVLNEHAGSWLLLGELVTTLDLPPDDPATDRCGTCRRCIDACPTGAITAPYQLDARRCISYLTIEHRGPIEPDLSEKMGDWLYGCDICQDVCPWNSKALEAMAPELQPRFPTGSLDVRAVADWSDHDYRTVLRGSAMKRVKLPILQRNARIVSRNAARLAAMPVKAKPVEGDE